MRTVRPTRITMQITRAISSLIKTIAQMGGAWKCKFPTNQQNSQSANWYTWQFRGKLYLQKCFVHLPESIANPCIFAQVSSKSQNKQPQYIYFKNRAIINMLRKDPSCDPFIKFIKNQSRGRKVSSSIELNKIIWQDFSGSSCCYAGEKLLLVPINVPFMINLMVLPFKCWSYIVMDE